MIEKKSTLVDCGLPKGNKTKPWQPHCHLTATSLPAIEILKIIVLIQKWGACKTYQPKLPPIVRGLGAHTNQDPTLILKIGPS